MRTNYSTEMVHLVRNEAIYESPHHQQPSDFGCDDKKKKLTEVNTH